MTAKEFLDSGVLCVTCGTCCMDISNAPIELEDIQRLMDAYGMTFEEVHSQMVYQDQSGFLAIRGRPAMNPEDGDSHGDTCICSAYDVRADGKRVCTVYENRMKICREFVCQLLRDVKEYVLLNGQVDQANTFYGVPDEQLAERALGQIPAVRSLYDWMYSKESRYNLAEEDKHRFRQSQKILHGLIQISPATFSATAT
jgi:Fe-S-cluster containining protein